MTKKQKNFKKKVFFNTSVILAGLNSPQGASAKVLDWSQTGRIEGVASEIVLDEAMRHAPKINLTPPFLEKAVSKIVEIIPPPEEISEKYLSKVKDVGDIHLFTSSEEARVDYLVSLDRKHVLSLSGKIKIFKIITPGDLIREFRELGK